MLPLHPLTPDSSLYAPIRALLLLMTTTPHPDGL